MIRKPPERRQGDPPLVTAVRAAGSGGRTLITAATHAYWKVQAIFCYAFCGLFFLVSLVTLLRGDLFSLVIMAMTFVLFMICRFLLAITKPRSLRDAAARQYEETLAQLEPVPPARVNATPPRLAKPAFGKRVQP